MREIGPKTRRGSRTPSRSPAAREPHDVSLRAVSCAPAALTATAPPNWFPLVGSQKPE